MKAITSKIKSSKGFTALEVITTVGIATIFSALALPSFFSFSNKAKLDCAAKEIVSEVASVRMNAVSANVAHHIDFANNGQYTIGKDLNSNGSIEQNEIIASKDLSEKYHDLSVTVSSNPEFYARGTCSGATVTITKANRTKTITINAMGSAIISQ